MKRLLIVISFLFILIAYPLDVLALPDYSNDSFGSRYSDYEYVINEYDIDMVVNENNTFDITEKIKVYFNEEKHGIFRSIPLKNEIERLDGSSSTNHARVTNVDVDTRYSTYKEDGNYVIKIGSPSQTLTGSKTYTIKYTYNIGKDPLKDADELYYNLIGPEWDTVIENVTFSIKMPKEFDYTKLGFSVGDVGSSDSSGIEYSVDGNTIVGSYDEELEEGDALTVRCELPDGYFVGAGFPLNFVNYIALILPVLFLLISWLLWNKFGKDDQIVDTVEFYPPKDFNSLEVGFLYNGKADSTDVVSLLIYLANKGYIKISEFEEKSLFSKTKGFKITKLKDYDGNNVNERMFLSGLFKKTSLDEYGEKIPGSKETNVNEVTKDDLYDSFYVTMDKILENINDSKNVSRIFDKKASKMKAPVILMIIATYLLITIPPLDDPSATVFAVLFSGIALFVFYAMIIGLIENKLSVGSSIFLIVMTSIWCLGFGGAPFVIWLLPALMQNTVYLISFIIGMICIVGMTICSRFLPKRTPYGNEILGKLRGFKNFLETAEKDQLESLVDKDPEYFYNILPYTYVLDVSDKWVKNFEAISLKAPSWYDSSDTFDVNNFGTFMNSTMSSATSYMSSSPSSGSDGGSSGGGSSGGGSGGGGGGSW